MKNVIRILVSIFVMGLIFILNMPKTSATTNTNQELYLTMTDNYITSIKYKWTTSDTASGTFHLIAWENFDKGANGRPQIVDSKSITASNGNHELSITDLPGGKEYRFVFYFDCPAWNPNNAVNESWPIESDNKCDYLLFDLSSDFNNGTIYINDIVYTGSLEDFYSQTEPTHSYETLYSIDNKIVYGCNKENCTIDKNNCESEVYISLICPDSTYGEDVSYEIENHGWIEAGFEMPELLFYKLNLELDEIPRECGSYTATMIYDDCVVRKNFTINHSINFDDFCEQIDSTCTEDGIKEHYSCLNPSCSVAFDKNGDVISDLYILKINHIFEDYVSDLNATCDTDGTKTAVCVMCEEATDTMLDENSRLGHDWGDPTYTWSNDNLKCEAKRVCLNDFTHIESETINSKKEVLEATYDSDGYTKYIVDFENEAFLTQEKVFIILKLEHEYSAPTYVWNSTNTECTATKECLTNSDLTEIEVVKAVIEVVNPTCILDGETKYIAIFKSESFEAQEVTSLIPALGHDKITINVKAPSYTSYGYTGDIVCSRCDYIFNEGNLIAKLQDNSSKEEIEEFINEIIEETEEINEALSVIEQETLVDITKTISAVSDSLKERLESGEISKDVYEERLLVVKAVTESSILVSASKSNGKELVDNIQNQMPQAAGINISSVIGEYYERQLNALLNKKEIVTVSLNNNEDLNYDISLETYQNALVIIEDSVSNMLEASLLIRECSSKKLIHEVNDYIERVSVVVFSDYDKEASDKAFVENAYKAILINLQEQTLKTLEESYEKSSNKEAIKANYEEEYSSVSDIEVFEYMVIEVMRLKFITVIENRFSLNSITDEEYEYLLNYASSLDEFEPIYKEIFKSWALNYENEYSITLEELSKTIINNAVSKTVSYNISNILTKKEIIVISSFISILVVVALIPLAFGIINKRRES